MEKRVKPYQCIIYLSKAMSFWKDKVGYCQLSLFDHYFTFDCIFILSLRTCKTSFLYESLENPSFLVLTVTLLKIFS